MDRRFKLGVEEVFNKQFNADVKGYSCYEVDEFLDLVIHDYQEYDLMIKELGQTLQKYEDQITNMKAKIVELEGKQSLAKEDIPVSNVDILKRLSRLEAETFKEK